MRKRTAKKILKVVLEYKLLDRWDMPYNGDQIYRAATTLLPPPFRQRYKGWRKQSKTDGYTQFIQKTERR